MEKTNKEKGYFERELESKGIKILAIKERNFWVSFFSIFHYNVFVKYKNHILKMNAWAGLDIPTMENLSFSILESIEEWENNKRFDEIIKMIHK